MDKHEDLVHKSYPSPGNDNVMLKPLSPGEWGSPAQLYNAAKTQGADPRATVRKSLETGNPGMDYEKWQSEQPSS